MAKVYGPEVRERARVLKDEGRSNRAVADQLGIGRRTIDTWFPSSGSEDVQPPSFGDPAGQGGEEGGAPGAGDGHRTGTGEQPPSQPRRAHERAPRKPPGGKVGAAPRPAGEVQLDFNAIKSYIEGAYKLGGKVAAERGDVLLGAVIDEHATAAARAWVRWIESEPKVAEMLRKLMVGTPAGEVIAIHVSIVFSYTLARGAAERIAADEALRRVQEQPAPS